MRRQDSLRYSPFASDLRNPWISRELREWLQVLSWKNPADDHWCLKCPGHSWFFDAILDTFPDANIVWTHRNISNVVASLSSLMHAFSFLYRDRFDPVAFRNNLVDLVDIGVRRLMNCRDALPANEQQRVYDVHFKNLMEDPIPVVKDIYRAFGYDYTEEFEANMRRWLKENPQGKHGSHNYSLDAYGIDRKELEQRFEEYVKRFSLSV